VAIYHRFWFIPPGNAGNLATLERMAALIARPDPAVVDAAAMITAAHWARAGGAVTALGLAEALFEYVRAHLHYTPDYNDGDVIEEIGTPGYLLDQIRRYGAARGDCDDYVILLGALYHAMGWPVTLIAIARHTDRILDHVYLRVETPEGARIADGIVRHPFGWEVPRAEQWERVEWPIAA
jgi:transglutaminase-like putative cysteine protease